MSAANELTVSLHQKQLEIFESDLKIHVVCAARRFGKSRLIIWSALVSALTFAGTIDPVSPEVVLLTEPTRTQASGILWKPLVALAESPAIAPYVANINRSEYRIEFKYGKPAIIVTGANDRDGDGLRGKRIYRYFGDEFQDVKPGVFDTVILPAMADTPGSKAMLTFTPKGRLNHTYELMLRAESDPETYRYFHATTLDNPYVSRAEVERARRTLPPRIFRQEFLASIEDAPGTVYSELSSENFIELSELPECQKYFLGVDFGENYPAVCILGLNKGSWYYIEGWQGNYGAAGEALPVPLPTFEAEIVRLARAYRVDGCYCDPSRPSSILGLRTLGKDHGLPGLQKAVAGYNRIADGISQVHSLIFQRKLLIPTQPQDEKHPQRVYGKDLGVMLEGYHYKSDRNGQVTEDIEDGQEDHLLDCLRYLISLPSGGKIQLPGGDQKDA